MFVDNHGTDPGQHQQVMPDAYASQECGERWPSAERTDPASD